MRTVSRLAAGLVGLALAPFALWGGFMIWFFAEITLQHPRPSPDYGMDGEYWGPRTLGDLREGIGWLFALGAAEGLVLAAGVAAATWGLTGRAPQWRRLALIEANAVCLVAVVTEPWWTG